VPVGESPAPEGPSETIGDVVRPRRPQQTFTDMARSLGLMALVIAGLLLVGPARTLVFPGGARMPAADYREQVIAFKRVVGQVLAPGTLPKAWRANAATFTVIRPGIGAVLHIGWATPGAHFAGLDEASGPVGTLVRRVLGPVGNTVSGMVVINGAPWEVRRSSRGETALTRSDGKVSAVITGSASDASLRLLAASLSLA